MEIEVTRVTSWSRVLDSARWTVSKKGLDKEPGVPFKRSVLMAQHSPIRLLEFDIKIKGIPYRIATHFVRHHIGVEKFQCTLRDDKNEGIKDSGELPQNYPVNLWMCANAEALINISQKRLCACAALETRKVWSEVVSKVREVDPELGQFLVPTCIYRGFCPEPFGCGYADTSLYRERLVKYRNLIKRK